MATSWFPTSWAMAPPLREVGVPPCDFLRRKRSEASTKFIAFGACTTHAASFPGNAMNTGLYIYN